MGWSVLRDGPATQLIAAGALRLRSCEQPRSPERLAVVERDELPTAEPDLSSSEGRYHDLVQHQPELICRFRPDTVLTFVNDAYCRYWHMTPEELLGHSFLMLIPELEHAGVRRALERLSAEHPLASYEHLVTTPDGEERWQQWTDRALLDSAGNIVEIQSTGRDITERKMAEEALRASERRYRTLVHNIPDVAVFLFDRELRVLIADGSALQHLGYTSASLEGRSLGEMLDSQARSTLEPIYRATLAGAAPREVEVEFRGRTYRINPVALRDAGGEANTGMLIMQDVIERHVYETAILRLNVQLEQRIMARTAELSQSLRALNDSRRFGDRVAATSPALLLVYNPNSERITYASRDVVSYFGIDAAPPGDATQAAPAAITGSHGLLRSLAAYADIADGEVTEYEAQVVPLQGDPRWYAVRASVFRRDDDGQVLHVLIAALDISGRLRMEDELRAFQRQLLRVQDAERAHIARELHDQIGQLLTGLNLTLAAAGHTAGADAAPFIGRAQKLVGELTAEVRRLSVALRPAMLDDLGLLATLAWHLQQFEEQTGVHVALQHDGLAAPLPAEVAMAAYRIIQEALTNIARHADVKQAMVDISSSEGRLHLVVVDAGRGFKPSAVQAQSSGLRGIRERVRLLGGTVTITSQPGVGTSVEVSLPLDSGDGRTGDD